MNFEAQLNLDQNLDETLVEFVLKILISSKFDWTFSGVWSSIFEVLDHFQLFSMVEIRLKLKKRKFGSDSKKILRKFTQNRVYTSIKLEINPNSELNENLITILQNCFDILLNSIKIISIYSKFTQIPFKIHSKSFRNSSLLKIACTINCLFKNGTQNTIEACDNLVTIDQQLHKLIVNTKNFSVWNTRRNTKENFRVK